MLRLRSLARPSLDLDVDCKLLCGASYAALCPHDAETLIAKNQVSEMTVSELAKRAGVAAHVVRYYTQRQLLTPRRNAHNRYRDYSDSDLYRLRFIARAKQVGFTLSDIKLILGDADAGVTPCPQVRELILVRAKENEQRLTEEQRLHQRIADAIAEWEKIPDRPPDHESLCRLIDAVAFDEENPDHG